MGAHSAPGYAGRVLCAMVATLCLGAWVALASQHPLSGVAMLAVCGVAMAATIVAPTNWPVWLLSLWPVASLATWTGWLIVEEFEQRRE